MVHMGCVDSEGEASSMRVQSSAPSKDSRTPPETVVAATLTSPSGTSSDFKDAASFDFKDGASSDFKDGASSDFKDGASFDFKDGASFDFKDGASHDFKDRTTRDFKDGASFDFKDGTSFDFKDRASFDVKDRTSHDFKDGASSNFQEEVCPGGGGGGDLAGQEFEDPPDKGWEGGRIPYWHPPGQQQQEQELATKMLQIQSKRFYLDVKQNRRGRFIKVAEVGADGRRSQIFLALSVAEQFRGHLSAFSDYYASLGPPNPDSVPDDGKLKSEVMVKDNRRYYLDLKENTRGRFLRVSQTIPRGGPRSQIAIPAQGMIEFRDALTDLLDEFGTEDGGYKGELPEGRHMRVENKNFYFDIGQNNRGIYMRVSEVKTNFRTAITIPEKSWARFRDVFGDYCDKMKEIGGGGGGAGSSGGGGEHKTTDSGEETPEPK